MRIAINRRTLLSTATALPLGFSSQTPDVGIHEFSDLRDASMYFRSVQYDVAHDIDGDIFTLHSWACGFLAHPASRSMYRQYPNLFEDGVVDFSTPGLPAMSSNLIERSPEIFGEDGTLTIVTKLNGEDGHGALAICLNGVLVQLLCIEPSPALSPKDAESAVRTIAHSIQTRDPEFYGRGEMTREILGDHVASPDDVRLVFPHMRVREDTYVYTQDDGMSDFWE